MHLLPSWPLLLFSLAHLVQAHDNYLGRCPKFTPMTAFSWDKFKGAWYAMEKFDTRSKCLTYEFAEDEQDGKFVKQRSELTPLAKLSVDNKAIYKGKLTVPNADKPANMTVRFPLSVLGSASFIVMDTDYDNYAMVCTCQSTKIFVELLTFHRRSCTILQRTPERKLDISKKMHDLLNSQVHVDDSDDKADHDFDVINHNGCKYGDDDKGLKIDVDKILGNSDDKIEKSVIAVVKDLGETIIPEDNSRDVEIIDISKMPLRESDPKV